MEEKIIKLLQSVNREGMQDFICEMQDNGFFTAACSGGNHLCKEGGLAEHSLNVCEYALKLYDAWKDEGWKHDVPKESVIIASLLHDYGKTGDFGKEFYSKNILKSGNQSDSKPFKRNPDLLEKNHAVKSVIEIERWIDLTEDEEFAILHHDGLFDLANKEAWSTPTPLLMILHFADMWCSRVVEGEK